MLGNFIVEHVKSSQAAGVDDSASTLASVWNAYITSLCKLSLSYTATGPDTNIADDILLDGTTATTSSPTIDPTNKNLLLTKAQLSLSKMKELGISPDIYTMNSYLQALLESDQVPNNKIIEALIIYKEMQDHHRQTPTRESGVSVKPKPDRYTFSILSTALGRYGYTDLALELYRSSSGSVSEVEETTTGTGSTETLIDVAVVNSLLRAEASGVRPMRTVQLFCELFNVTLPWSSSSSSGTSTTGQQQSTTRKMTSSSVVSSSSQQRAIPVPAPDVITFTLLFAAMANSIKYDIKSHKLYDTPYSPPSPPTAVTSSTSNSRSVSSSSRKTSGSQQTGSSASSVLQQTGLVTSKDGDRFYEQNTNYKESVQSLSPVVTTPTTRTQPKPSSASTVDSGDFDLLLRSLYRYMRYFLCLTPDDMLVGVLKVVFQAHTKLTLQRKPGMQCFSVKYYIY